MSYERHQDSKGNPDEKPRTEIHQVLYQIGESEKHEPKPYSGNDAEGPIQLDTPKSPNPMPSQKTLLFLDSTFFCFEYYLLKYLLDFLNCKMTPGNIKIILCQTNKGKIGPGAVAQQLKSLS